MKRAILAILILVMLASAPVFARSTYYFTGDQVFSIRAGVNFPGFFSFYNNPERPSRFFWNTHLKLGGFASIAYRAMYPSISPWAESSPTPSTTPEAIFS